MAFIYGIKLHPPPLALSQGNLATCLQLQVGMGWAGKVVSAGALMGIVTALIGSLLGQARIYVTLGRQHLLSPWLVSGLGPLFVACTFLHAND